MYRLVYRLPYRLPALKKSVNTQVKNTVNGIVKLRNLRTETSKQPNLVHKPNQGYLRAWPQAHALMEQRWHLPALYHAK